MGRNPRSLDCFSGVSGVCVCLRLSLQGRRSLDFTSNLSTSHQRAYPYLEKRRCLFGSLSQPAICFPLELGGWEAGATFRATGGGLDHMLAALGRKLQGASGRVGAIRARVTGMFGV